MMYLEGETVKTKMKKCDRMKIKKIVFINLQILMVGSLIIFLYLTIKFHWSFTPYILFFIGGEIGIISAMLMERKKDRKKK